MASSSAIGSPSNRELRTNTSKPGSSSSTSSREPTNVDPLGQPQVGRLVASSASSGPEPTSTSRAPGWSRPRGQRPQQRGLVLLGGEVADRADHRLVGREGRAPAGRLRIGPRSPVGGARPGIDTVEHDLGHRPGRRPTAPRRRTRPPRRRCGRRWPGWPTGSAGGTGPTGCARCGRTRAAGPAAPGGPPPRAAACGCGRRRCRRSRTSRRSRRKPGHAVARRRVEAVDRHAGGLDVAHEGVLPGQEVRDLDPEACAIEQPHGAVQQPLGAASPQALGEHQHTDRAARLRLACRSSPAVNVADAWPGPATSARRPAHSAPTTPISKRSRHRRRAARPHRTVVGQHPVQPGGEGGGVAGRHQHPGLAVDDHLGHRPDRGGHDRAAGSARPRSARRACPRCGWAGPRRRTAASTRPRPPPDPGEPHPPGASAAACASSAVPLGTVAGHSSQTSGSRPIAAIAAPTSFSAVSEPA